MVDTIGNILNQMQGLIFDFMEGNDMSKWAEIRSDYYNDQEEQQYVDAWLTEDENEEGKVIAKINLVTKKVEYLDSDAKYDEYAQEVISEVLEDENERSDYGSRI